MHMTSANTCHRCEDLASDARRVLSERCAPDERHCSCVLRLRAEIARLTAERDELRLTLLAEQGDSKGAPEGWTRTGWLWWRPLGPKSHQAEVHHANTHPDGDPWQWTLYTPTLAAEGYAPTAREAMLAADKAFQETT